MSNLFNIISMTTDEITTRYPSARRFILQGFQKSPRLIDHDDGVVGLLNPVTGQAIRLHLVTGDISCSI